MPSLINQKLQYDLFLIPFKELSEPLSQSFKTFGIIEPLLLGPFQIIIDGHMRYQYLVKNQINFNQTKTLDLTDQQATELWFSLQNSKTPLSFIQKAKICLKAKNFDSANGTRFFESFFKGFGFENHPRVQSGVLACGDLPESLAYFAHQKDFSMRQCVYYTHFDPEWTKMLMEQIKNLPITASILEEIFSGLRDILKRDQIKSEQALNLMLDLFDSIGSDSKISPAQTLHMLRNKIKEKKYPIMTEIHGKIESKIKQLKIPSAIKLTWDPSLEHPQFKLQTVIDDDVQNLNKLGQFLIDGQFQSQLTELFKIYRGGQ